MRRLPAAICGLVLCQVAGLEPAWCQEEPPAPQSVRVELESRHANKTPVDVTHVPAVDPEVNPRIVVYEQPRPAPRIVVEQAGPRPRPAPSVMVQPPAVYQQPTPPVMVQPPAVYQQPGCACPNCAMRAANGGAIDPVDLEQTIRFWHWTHYRPGFRVFAFMPKRYVRRRADSPPMRMWDHYMYQRMGQ